MRVKDAERILNVSRATVHNWLRSGKLRLNKVLSNGYRDIEDASVYEAVSSTYEPSESKNRIVVFLRDGRTLRFDPSDETAAKIVAYLEELDRLAKEV